MLRTLFFITCYVIVFGLAASAPFILTLGYEWTDLVRPSSILFGAAKDIPFALFFGVAAFGSYLAFDRRDPPQMGLVTILTIMMVVWTTLTTTCAAVPDEAWVKWDATLKTLVF